MSSSNYKGLAIVTSIILIILGAIKTFVVLLSFGDYIDFLTSGDAILIGVVLCDFITAFGSLVVGVAGLIKVRQKTGVLPWSILSFVVCLGYFITIIVAMSMGESGGRHMGILAAIPAMLGISLLYIQKNHKAETETPKES